MPAQPEPMLPANEETPVVAADSSVMPDQSDPVLPANTETPVVASDSPVMPEPHRGLCGPPLTTPVVAADSPATGMFAKKLDILNKTKVAMGHLLILSAFLLLVIAGAVGGAVWFYQQNIAPQLAARPSNPPPAASPAPVADTSALESSLERAQSQILTLQRQLDAQREERERTQARLQEMADRMALVIKQSSFVPSADTTRVSAADASQVAALLPNVSPSISELILLKERNRLSEYGDKAIASGSREGLQAIVDTLLDPAMKHLQHASQAEFKRVQAFYDFSITIDPGYTLPVQEMFKDQPVRTEADLTPAQLTKVLQDAAQPWEARLRCAYLLRGSTDTGTDAVLLRALKEDPSLDVAKQAQTTFEKRVGRKFRLFDIPSIDAWWQAQKGK